MRKEPLAVCEPLSNRVVIKRDDTANATGGGILLPENVGGKKQAGTVISVGPGRVTEDGRLVPMVLRIGDRVLVSGYAGLEILDSDVDQDSDYLIIREDDVLAKLPVGY